MALRRRSGARSETNLWPGFVDVMTSLLLVVVFILSIFMVMQFFLRATIRGQGQELNQLERDLTKISQILGATTKKNESLEKETSEARKESTDLSDQLNRLQFDYQEQGVKIESFETQVASLIARNTNLAEDNQNLHALETHLTDQTERLERSLALALAQISEKDLEAKLAQARADALEAMARETDPNVNAELKSSIAQVIALASLAKTDPEFVKSQNGGLLNEQVEKLSQLELERLADQAAASYLREKLANSETELTAMTLALEAERKKAEDQLTLIAAINAEKTKVNGAQITAEEKTRALLAIANEEINARENQSADDARKLALLNAQTAELRAQLGALQRLLDNSVKNDGDTKIQLDQMGASLNAELARVAAEQKKRADDLESYRSDFFGSLREVLKDVDGISISGDRFVFSSEVLFAAGSAELSEAGRIQIGKVAEQIKSLEQNIPGSINWILRVDGHTDMMKIGSPSPYKDNWDLSQARALSVVRFMINDHQVNQERLAATGFGEFHPIDKGTSAEALARNRRIELKLTEQ